jgi:hypothetical protein
VALSTGLDITIILTIAPSASDGESIATPSSGVANVSMPEAGLQAGTRLATPGLAVAVEDLGIGELVRTLHGGPRRVKSIVMRSYAGPFAQNPAVLPVCIQAGALSDGVPVRDLYVSPGHAVWVDGVLVHAGRLVNGVSITQPARTADVAYYHVELEGHEVIYAEGCPVETFRDENFRGPFQNAADYAARYKAGESQAPCLERLDDGFQLHAIQMRLLERAGGVVPVLQGPLLGYIDVMSQGVVSGWAKTVDWAEVTCGIEQPVSLDVYAGEQRLGRVLANRFRQDVKDAGYGAGYHGFEFALPAGVTSEVSVRRSVDGEVLGLSGTAALL